VIIEDLYPSNSQAAPSFTEQIFLFLLTSSIGGEPVVEMGNRIPK